MACNIASSSSRGLLAGCSMANTLRSSMRQGAQPLLRAVAPSSKRSLHSLPQLPEKLRTNGCEPLFSAQTIKLLWDDWQAGLLNRLNDEVRGTPWENSSVAETVIGAALEPEHIQAFNYASMALNNSFFLNGLKPKTLAEDVSHWSYVAPPKPSDDFCKELESHFDSLPAFKLAFSSAAYGMAGSGYVWLARDGEGNLGIIPTFGAGTLLVQNRQQRGTFEHGALAASVVDKQQRGNQPPSSPAPLSSSLPPSPFSTGGGVQARSIRTNAMRSQRNDRADSNGEELYPLLCVSVHERDWLPDYGMWGKEEYLMRFWECVDWDRVSSLHKTYQSLV